MADSKHLVQKLWNYCDILRDDGLSYGDYVEQLTFLLFLKMDDERSNPPYSKKSDIPKEYNWQSLISKDGAELETQYIKILTELGKREGIIGVIFKKAQNRIQDPAKLRKLIVELINKETWLSLEADVKGDAYEGLLEKNAADVKGGAGQYFTPRHLINAMVEMMKPEPGIKIHDPACGTGGFLLSAYNYISKNYNLNRDQKQHLKHETFSGNEIVPMAARLCVMNLYLHGIHDGVEYGDSLSEVKESIWDMVLTNPPFGVKSGGEIPNRPDFNIETANKQLNFVQHVMSGLKQGGKGAMVLPDGVLTEGGAGKDLRKDWLKGFNVHTILRLPLGVFAYVPGVKANVVFFDKGKKTDEVWIYDLRTNIEKLNKGKPLTDDLFKELIDLYDKRKEN